MDQSNTPGLVGSSEWLCLEPERDDIGDQWRNAIVHFTMLPRKGTPATDLTDRDRLALAIAAGAPTEAVMEGTKLTFRTTVPVGVADRGDGGYIVAVGSNAPSDLVWCCKGGLLRSKTDGECAACGRWEHQQ